MSDATQRYAPALQGYLPFVLLLFLLATSVCAIAAENEGIWHKSQDFPVEMIGTWQVSKVRIDKGATRKTLYEWDDPRLLGRILKISHEAIQSDLPEDRQCLQPKALFRQMDLSPMIQVTLPGMYERTAAEAVADYELPLNLKRPASVAWISCSKGSFGPELLESWAKKLSLPEVHSWLINNDKDKFALLWYDQTVLLLERIANGQKTRPSFACTMARSITEQALCQSISLASFDASIAQAYKLVLKNHCEGVSGCRSQQQKKQAAWAKKRDQCGADAQCLTDAMRSRLEQLMVIQSSAL